jgi:hypothetical protein
MTKTEDIKRGKLFARYHVEGSEYGPLVYETEIDGIKVRYFSVIEYAYEDWQEVLHQEVHRSMIHSGIPLPKGCQYVPTSGHWKEDS